MSNHLKHVGVNRFSLEYYASILRTAKDAGHVICTVEDYWDLGCPETGHLVLRHDLDAKPHLLERMLDVERGIGCRSTIYVRVAGSPYNFLDYPTFATLQRAEEDGFRIGLHSGFVEFGVINRIKPIDVLVNEAATLRAYFDVTTIAPHRDINYALNSLPYLETNWFLPKFCGFTCQAYNKRIMGSATYVSETLAPHLRWGSDVPPEDLLRSSDKRSVYVLSHPHWWYTNHPFEEWDIG